MSKFCTYYHTIKYLKATQILHRICNKFKSKQLISISASKVKTIDLAIPELDMNDEFISRFAIDDLSSDYVRLLNQDVLLDYSTTTINSVSPLIRNNIFYFEYSVALSAKYAQTKDIGYVKRFTRLYNRYLSSDKCISSYVYALHIPNLLIAISLLGDVISADLRNKIYDELYAQYIYLKTHLEKHLLANHYFEDLKALVIASYLFGDMTECNKYCKKLKKQVDEQINDDGLHYELSSMYHKIIWEDLLRIANLTRYDDFPKLPWLNTTINKMADAALTMELGIGHTPLFNDAGDNVAKPLNSLIKATERLTNHVAISAQSLPQSGYYRLDSKHINAIIDAGYIGPDYQPGHVQCDCLSFELSINGNPIFVNSGTLLYQGYERKYFRSTRAHNTVMINNHEQSLCWGEHRVAKRLRCVKAERTEKSVKAKCINYCGEVHTREFSLDNDIFTVVDMTPNISNIPVNSYLHVANGITISQEGNSIIVDNICVVETFGANIRIHKEGELTNYAPGFGDLRKGSCIELNWIADKKKHGFSIKQR